ncbi:MAG TPA: hypothetical protein VE961_19590 [Pyrinomonadaceae bacterium]|nr:hypothetical protein [Pyrinomonadaceae bacterium]
MSLLAKRIETVANIGIIVVAILVGIAAVRYFRAKPSNSPQPTIAAGTKVNLPNEDWAKNRKTLLLALSTQCKYCSASAGFYQRLIQTASPNTRLVAVLPQPRDASAEYLSGLKVTIDDIQQVSPPSLGVSATPTLILVDGAGAVVKSWIGQLPHDKEEEVLAAVR